MQLSCGFHACMQRRGRSAKRERSDSSSHSGIDSIVSAYERKKRHKREKRERASRKASRRKRERKERRRGIARADAEARAKAERSSSTASRRKTAPIPDAAETLHAKQELTPSSSCDAERDVSLKLERGTTWNPFARVVQQRYFASSCRWAKIFVS